MYHMHQLNCASGCLINKYLFHHNSPKLHDFICKPTHSVFGVY